MGRKQTLVLFLVVEALAQVGLLYTGKAHLEIPFLLMAFVAGLGGGAFFPLFAAIVPDYFGENYNASNYGIVYSAKLASSLVGIGLGSSLIGALGYTGAYLIGAGLALVSAGIALTLRQPQEPPEPVPVAERERQPAAEVTAPAASEVADGAPAPALAKKAVA
jgi:MFS family permease